MTADEKIIEVAKSERMSAKVLREFIKEFGILCLLNISQGNDLNSIRDFINQFEVHKRTSIKFYEIWKRENTKKA